MPETREGKLKSIEENYSVRLNNGTANASVIEANSER